MNVKPWSSYESHDNSSTCKVEGSNINAAYLWIHEHVDEWHEEALQSSKDGV